MQLVQADSAAALSIRVEPVGSVANQLLFKHNICTVGMYLKKLTSDDSIVGSLNNCTIELDDVAVAEDTKDFSLVNEHTKRKHYFFLIMVVVSQMSDYLQKL